MEEKNEKKGLSIASLIISILSIVGMFVPFVPCLALVLAILALVFGIIGRKKGGKGMATAGIVISIIVIVIDLIMSVFEIIGAIGLIAAGGLGAVGGLAAIFGAGIPYQDSDIAFEQGYIDESYFTGEDEFQIGDRISYDENGFPIYETDENYGGFSGNGIGKVIEDEITPGDLKDEYEPWFEDEELNEYRSQFIFWDSDQRYLQDDDVMYLNEDEIRLAINEIYARRGRQFTTEEMQEYFNSCTWYEPLYTPEEFEKIEKELFNDYEWQNIQILSKYREKLQ